MYSDLASWWPLLSPPAEYAEEAGVYAAAIDAAAARPVSTVLELGSGGGNNASHLKARYELTLVDLSPAMIEVSRALNPELEHIQGDMRSVRLGRTFDAVLVHDAIMYMTTAADLRAAVATAGAHLAPEGIALFVPDDTTETYRPQTSCGGHDGDGRSMRYLDWSHAPSGDTVRTTYVYVLTEGDRPPRVEFEDHRTGLFSRAAWLAFIAEAGLEPAAVPYPHGEFDVAREMFLGRAPAAGGSA
jgi:SAM-dependent methyltransferase